MNILMAQDACRSSEHKIPQAVAKQAEAWALEGPKGAAPGRPQGLPPFTYFLQDPPYGLILISVHFLRLVGLLFMGPCMALFTLAILGYFDWRWFLIIADTISPNYPSPCPGLGLK